MSRSFILISSRPTNAYASGFVCSVKSYRASGYAQLSGLWCSWHLQIHLKNHRLFLISLTSLSQHDFSIFSFLPTKLGSPFLWLAQGPPKKKSLVHNVFPFCVTLPQCCKWPARGCLWSCHRSPFPSQLWEGEVLVAVGHNGAWHPPAVHWTVTSEWAWAVFPSRWSYCNCLNQDQPWQEPFCNEWLSGLCNHASLGLKTW